MAEQGVAGITPQAQTLPARLGAVAPGQVEQPGLVRPADRDTLHRSHGEPARVRHAARQVVADAGDEIVGLLGAHPATAMRRSTLRRRV